MKKGQHIITLIGTIAVLLISTVASATTLLSGGSSSVSGKLISTVAGATTWIVHPSGKPAAGQNEISGLSNIDWSQIKPGDVVQLKGSEGVYQEPFVIAVKGTSAATVKITSVPGETPVIENSILVVKSEYVEISNLTVTKSQYAGIIIKDGSNHITVSNCSVHDNSLGIWFGEQAGCSNLIVGNQIYNNSTHGVAVDLVNCSSGTETIISSNTVYGNGHHGIEIMGNYYIIEGNVVYQNGSASPGTSGIHIYSRSAQDNSGDYNIIRYNVSFQNKESNGPDGNGIQLDQWCDYNEVYYNICFENDGAGISIYDSSNSKVYNNTLIGNMVDPGGTHPFKAELYLASDVPNNVNHVKNVTVVNNILVATRPSTPAIALYSPATSNPQTIGHNLLYHTAGDIIYFWDGKTGRDISSWNQLAAGGGDDIVGDPQFVSLQGTTPSQVSDLALKSTSPAIDKGINMGQTRDLSGNTVPQGNGVDIGALESSSAVTTPAKPEPPKNLRIVQ